MIPGSACRDLGPTGWVEAGLRRGCPYLDLDDIPEYHLITEASFDQGTW